MSIHLRKDDHLKLCLEEDVNSTDRGLWDDVELNHCALPEINFDEINISTDFLGQRLNAPFLISSMTGGTPDGEDLNLKLAELSALKQIPMGVGSQRVLLEKNDPNLFQIKKTHPKAIIWANIGLVQLNYGVSIDDCKRLIDLTQASALIVHLNPLQEAIQAEGDRNFKGLLPKLSQLCSTLSLPVIVKETGCGLSAKDAIRCIEAGVQALDVAGRGGTHWGYIEGLRHTERLALGQQFRNWGMSTVESLQEVRDAVGPKFPVIASGGIRHGLDAAKAIAIGANLVGLARPFLTEAHKGIEELVHFYDQQHEALRIAMFCTGSPTLKEFSQSWI